jgi:membrane associated rhomboid family serine protease
MERLSHSPVTLILIGINVAFFLAEELYTHFFASSLFPYLALSREGLAGGDWWQVLTYAFLHGSPLHLLVNMLGLWFTGPLLEELLGALCYLGLYAGGAIVGGVLQMFLAHGSVLVGASGSVCALLVGFATLLPRLEITALIFFVIPVKMRAATLGWLVIVGSFLFWLLGIEKEIGHMAHLGGGIAGYVICRIYQACGLVRFFPLEPPPLSEDH